MTTPESRTPTYVVVGHLASDVAPDGYVPGGTVLYAALTARRLGVETGVVTSVAPDADLRILEGAQVSVRPAPTATIFDNRYGPDGRVQYLHGVAASLGPADVPAAWRAAPIVHLGPIADEVDPDLARLFPHALRGATPQGWLRRWDAAALAQGEARVRHLPHQHITGRLPELDVIVLSEEDVAGDPGAVEAYRTRTRILVLTHGARGATIYAGNGALHIPAFPAREVNPTGAGDVFAAAFLIRYQQSIAAGRKDLLDAGRFAAAVASFAVEGPGASTVPTLAQVEERLAEFSRQPSAITASPETDSLDQS